MPKHLFRKLALTPEAVQRNWCLQLFGTILHSPNLWHLNRHAVARAFATGFFWALIPIPFQMVFAAGTAILWRANLPLSIALVWLTNPVTIPPIFYATYRMGAWILDAPLVHFPPELDADWFFGSLEITWRPLFVGSLIGAFIASLLGYAAIHWFWRWYIVKRYRSRRPPRAVTPRQPDTGL